MTNLAWSPLDKLRLVLKINGDRNLSLTEHRFAVQLICGHLNSKTGRCDPAYATIAEALGCSRRSAMRAKKKLVDLGYLTVKGRLLRSNAFTFERGDIPVTLGGEVTRVSPPEDADVTTGVTGMSLRADPKSL